MSGGVALTPGYKVYGRYSALSVELTRTRANERSPKGMPTISFEMAAFDSANSSAGANWAEKTIVQVSLKELPQVIAVLTGHREVAEFKYHGDRSNKSYVVSPTAITIQTAGVKHSVSLTSADRFEISALAMKQLQRSHGSLSSDLIYRLIADCH